MPRPELIQEAILRGMEPKRMDMESCRNDLEDAINAGCTDAAILDAINKMKASMQDYKKLADQAKKNIPSVAAASLKFFSSCSIYIYICMCDDTRICIFSVFSLRARGSARSPAPAKRMPRTRLAMSSTMSELEL